MKAFNKFYFEDIDFDASTLQAKFSYSFDQEIFFTETIDFTSVGFQISKTLDRDIIHNLMFNASLALGISYYKLYPTNELVVKTGHLDQYQKDFWQKFYIQGLGEFFFVNKLSPSGKVNFVCDYRKDNRSKHYFKTNTHKSLLAIGGGKDSLVSAELMKQMGLDFNTITFGKNYVLHDIVAKKIGGDRLVIIRKMDSQLFELNKQGYYNGHVPITGIIAFVLIMVAYLYDYSHIVLSNERSADYGNNTKGEMGEINHQYSKSLEFEQDLSLYIDKYISQDLKYFSLLKGMYESKIIELFAKLGKKYFDVFSSCNTNFKLIQKSKNIEKRRCNNCPKCAFVYAIMRPCLQDSEVKTIFGEELYEKKSLEDTFGALLDTEGVKPFECVGTEEEVLFAMRQFIENFKYEGSYPYIIEKLKEKGLLPVPINVTKYNALKKQLFTICDEHNIPEDIENKFKNYL